MKCPICNGNNSMNECYVKEKMLGTFNEFVYLQCENCRVLLLKDTLNDFSLYYPENYYSFKNPKNQVNTVFIRFLKKVRFLLYSNNFFQHILPTSKRPNYFTWLIPANLKFKDKILDVGCGCGYQLYTLRNTGFKNLYGIDPYITHDKKDYCIQIEKCDIFNYNEINFDLIIFNHSLEHIRENHSVLLRAKQLLNENGRILIRTPLVNRSFEIYKSNWVEIDAPRHVIIHSLRSLRILLKSVNLTIRGIIYDTDEFEFWGSEQFCNDIPTNSHKSYSVDPHNSIFSSKQMSSFKNLAQDYNSRGIAGRACFFIEKRK